MVILSLYVFSFFLAWAQCACVCILHSAVCYGYCLAVRASRCLRLVGGVFASARAVCAFRIIVCFVPFVLLLCCVFCFFASQTRLPHGCVLEYRLAVRPPPFVCFG